MKKVIIGAIAILAVMNGVALHETQQLKAEIIYQQQLLDAQEKYFRAEIYRANAIFYFIASPAFQYKAAREKLQADMKQACEKYKAIKED
jgi:hypothetical protein